MSIETGGGAGVEGDAKSARDFIGRDQNQAGPTFNTFVDSRRFDEGGEPRTEKEALTWVYVSIFGSKKIDHLGILDRLERLEHDILWLKVIIVLLLFGLLAVTAIQLWTGP